MSKFSFKIISKYKNGTIIFIFNTFLLLSIASVVSVALTRYKLICRCEICCVRIELRRMWQPVHETAIDSSKYMKNTSEISNRISICDI